MVIDRDTGQTPPSAAERMAEYDRRMGNEPTRPAVREERRAPSPSTAIPADPIRTALAGATAAPPPGERMAKAVAAVNRKQPWQDKSPKPGAPAKLSTPPTPARIAQRAQPQAGGRKTIVTGKWWDAKGPRTIELGEKGQQTLTGGFVAIAVALLVGAIVALFVQPVIFFIGGFLLFRFGGQVLGPIGAGIVDKALAEKG